MGMRTGQFFYRGPAPMRLPYPINIVSIVPKLYTNDTLTRGTYIFLLYYTLAVFHSNVTSTIIIIMPSRDASCDASSLAQLTTHHCHDHVCCLVVYLPWLHKLISISLPVPPSNRSLEQQLATTSNIKSRLIHVSSPSSSPASIASSSSADIFQRVY